MGACFSSKNREFKKSTTRPTAQVVAVNGDLHRYNLPVLVSQILQAEGCSSSSSSSSPSIFICNSDSLYYDDYIPPLNDDHQLQENQMYFALPVSKLQQRLATDDMAALAVKASVAIQNAYKNYSNRRNNKARISPVLVVAQVFPDSARSSTHKSSASKPRARLGSARATSITKLHRHSTSRRAKLGARSFKTNLSTIHEDGSIL